MKEKMCDCCQEKFTTNSNTETCSATCASRQRIVRQQVNKVCEMCDTNFLGLPRATCCSDKCRANKRLAKKNQGRLGVDYIECPICKSHVKQLTKQHAISHGFEDAVNMKNILGLSAITCSGVRENNSGKNNPAYQHGGKLSAWSKHFVHGYDEQKHKSNNEKHSKFMKENAALSEFRFEFWLEKYDGNEDAAKIAYKIAQTRNLEWFVAKYGPILGTLNHSAKTEKWMKSYKKVNYSKISQELFGELVQHIDDTSAVYFATFDRDDMKQYLNKEYILKVEDTHVRLDFICLTKQKVIEFDGEYWHSSKHANPLREQLRDNKIINAGFKILHIGESEYKRNKQIVIEKCIQFLNQ